MDKRREIYQQAGTTNQRGELNNSDLILSLLRITE